MIKKQSFLAGRNYILMQKTIAQHSLNQFSISEPRLEFLLSKTVVPNMRRNLVFETDNLQKIHSIEIENTKNDESKTYEKGRTPTLNIKNQKTFIAVIF